MLRAARERFLPTEEGVSPRALSQCFRVRLEDVQERLRELLGPEPGGEDEEQ